MASKNRITTNFTDPTYDFILDLESKSNISQSKIIQSIVYDYMIRESENNILIESLISSRKERKDEYFNSTLRVGSFFNSKEKGEKGEKKKFYSSTFYEKELRLDINEFTPKEKSDICDVIMKTVGLNFKLTPLGMLASNLVSMLSPYSENIDYCLVICHEVIISKKSCSNNGKTKEYFSVKLKLSNHPITKSTYSLCDFRFLDFLNIKYESFFDVACHGWNTKKHSKITCIGALNRKASGAYFLGMSRYEINHEEQLQKEFKHIEEEINKYNEIMKDENNKKNKKAPLLYINQSFIIEPSLAINITNMKIFLDKKVIKMKF